MTEKEFSRELNSVLRSCMGSVISNTSFKYKRGDYKLPYKTGRLTNQGFKLVRTGENSWELYIDKNIVPYAEYLDDPSKVTHGYWSRAMEHYIRKVADDLGGELSNE